MKPPGSKTDDPFTLKGSKKPIATSSSHLGVGPKSETIVPRGREKSALKKPGVPGRVVENSKEREKRIKKHSKERKKRERKKGKGMGVEREGAIDEMVRKVSYVYNRNITIMKTRNFTRNITASPTHPTPSSLHTNMNPHSNSLPPNPLTLRPAPLAIPTPALATLRFQSPSRRMMG